ncbi:MAG TPA: hypothetical protein VGK81_10275 [Anaerolineae bacterium]
MAETPTIDTDTDTAAAPAGDATEPLLEKSWEEFEACEHCHGHAHIGETPDGDLYCEQCRAHFPRPAT